MLAPAPQLLAATQSAASAWQAYRGCPLFEIAPAGMPVDYLPGWPGECEHLDSVACTSNGVFLNLAAHDYDAASVIAHELGHVLNYKHGEGPAIMDPASWSGPGTVWCTLESRC